MKQRQPDLFTEDYHINRSNVYPSLDKAFFQIWYGPKEVGKTTEARMLVRQVSMAGQPVLYLSYKDLYTFDPFLKCFITYLELPKDSRFPEMTFSYLERALINEHAATKTAPLLVIDDINRASADDVLRWVTMGSLGEFLGEWKTVLITSPGEGIEKIHRVSDSSRAKKVIFGNVPREEAYKYLRKVKAIEGLQACWIWHVVGGKPGDLKKLVPSVSAEELTKADVEYLRDVTLREIVEDAYKEAQKSLGDNAKRNCFEDVLLALSDHTRGIRNGTVGQEKCLRDRELKRVLNVMTIKN
eukprot:gb/GECG01003591.1/.p1 GENE.gb/GECG01003591.1/~~gb/GECG01003591.1/.p1  ORF type:complete len:299 (+),score=28.61 gb/GECG01003591.1/:1-897(+)